MSGQTDAIRRFTLPVRRALKAVADQFARLDPRFHYKGEVAWCHDLSWVEEFQPYIGLDGRGGRRILDRRFMVVQMARAVADLRGSSAECGVSRGIGSSLICKVLGDTYRDDELHIGFDSFEGVAEPTEADRMANGRHFWFRGKLNRCRETAYQLLRDFDRCQLVKGWIPETFGPFAERTFRFVHIDVDLHDATRDSLAFFYPRMTRGGIFLFDDHGFVNCPGARKAALDFFSDKPERLIELATGQAFVIRGDSVA